MLQGPGVRELMAGARVGRLRTVRPQVISARVLFFFLSRSGRGPKVSSCLCSIIGRDWTYVPACLFLI